MPTNVLLDKNNASKELDRAIRWKKRLRGLSKNHACIVKVPGLWLTLFETAACRHAVFKHYHPDVSATERAYTDLLVIRQRRRGGWTPLSASDAEHGDR